MQNMKSMQKRKVILFFPEIPNKEIDGNPLISEFNKKIYISQTEFAKEFDIPDDFVSDKLPKYNTLEIIGLYKNVRDKQLKKQSN